QLPQCIQGLIQLLIGHRLDAALVLDLHFLGNEHGEASKVRCWLLFCHARDDPRALTQEMLMKCAQKVSRQALPDPVGLAAKVRRPPSSFELSVFSAFDGFMLVWFWIDESVTHVEIIPSIAIEGLCIVPRSFATEV